jgi:hypothetical protein
MLVSPVGTRQAVLSYSAAAAAGRCPPPWGVWDRVIVCYPYFLVCQKQTRSWKGIQKRSWIYMGQDMPTIYNLENDNRIKF